MAKIDLSGKSGWQSKSGDQHRGMQKGNFDFESIVLVPNDLITDWIKAGIMVKVNEGTLTLIVNGEELIYEEGSLVVFNEDNCENVEIRILEKVSLEIISART